MATLNRALFSYQLAKQASGKGVPATAPAFFLDAIGGNVTGKRTSENQLVGDGNVFSTGYDWINTIEAGGSIDVLGQPISAGLLCAAVLGTDTKTGAGDPYNHEIVPNNSAGGTAYYTMWKQLDSLWELYPDCKVTEVTISGSVDKKALQLTASILGASKPQNITAPTPATEETTAFNWNHAYGYWCVDGTMSHLCTLAKAVDLTTAEALANNLKAKYNIHCGAHTTAPHGKANDAANTVTSADADDQAKLNTLLNEMKGDYNTHRASATFHWNADTTHVVASADATDLPSSLILVNEILDDYNKHAGKAGSIKEFEVKLTRGFIPWYGESVVPYDLVEGRGDVTASFTLLIDELRLYNRIVYGVTDPATGTEITSLLMSGSFETKFDMGLTPERSFAIDIPEITYTADDIGEGVSGDTGGEAPALTVNGKASGTAPIITINAKNSYDTAY